MSLRTPRRGECVRRSLLNEGEYRARCDGAIRELPMRERRERSAGFLRAARVVQDRPSFSDGRLVRSRKRFAPESHPVFAAWAPSGAAGVGNRGGD